MSKWIASGLLLTCSLGCSREAVPPAAATMPAATATETELGHSPPSIPAGQLGEPTQSTDFYPLEFPKTLTYAIEYTAFVIGSGKGKVVTTFTEQVLDGVTYTAQTTKLTGTSWDTTYIKLYRLTEQGVMIRELNATEDRLFLPLPWDVGTKWTMKSGDGIVDCEITAIEETKCGETTYVGCLKIESSPQAGSTETRWFAPGVGLVRMEVHGPRYNSTTVLTSIEQ